MLEMAAAESLSKSLFSLLAAAVATPGCIVLLRDPTPPEPRLGEGGG